MLSATSVALVGATALAAAAGLAGAILVLRRQALASGAFAHAAFPGAALAAVLTLGLPGTAPGGAAVLIAGAMLAALAAAWSIAVLGAQRRVGAENAVALVMVAFFGVGALAFSYLETAAPAMAAQLRALLVGSAAAMPLTDALAAIGLLVAVGLAVRFALRPLILLLFDRELGMAQTPGMRWLDIVLVGLLAVMVAASARAIGVVITVGAAILPALTAKLFARHPGNYLALSAAFGGLIGAAGVGVSAIWDAVPAGPAIVAAGGILFGVGIIGSRLRGGL